MQIARVDHWFKNAFMLLGVILAVFYHPAVADLGQPWSLAIAVAATCLVASSNYVLNELLDGPTRPRASGEAAPAGAVRPHPAGDRLCGMAAAGGRRLRPRPVAERVLLRVGALPLGDGHLLQRAPVRTKEWPYLDVLSESVNNPDPPAPRLVRARHDQVPPLSLVIAYWMLGAFFMAMKRYAEYRHIGEPAVAAAYRRSFACYTEERLLVSLLLLRHRVRALRRHLHRPLSPRADAVRARSARGCSPTTCTSAFSRTAPCRIRKSCTGKRDSSCTWSRATLLFVLLMFTSMPALYEFFNVEAARMQPLWTLGGR